MRGLLRDFVGILLRSACALSFKNRAYKYRASWESTEKDFLKVQLAQTGTGDSFSGSGAGFKVGLILSLCFSASRTPDQTSESDPPSKGICWIAVHP